MSIGHKDKSGKFHPHTPYNGIRKSRDVTAKSKGIRLERTTETKLKFKYPYFSVWDRQTNRFLGSGRNQNNILFTLEDAITFYVEGSGLDEKDQQSLYKDSGIESGSIKKQTGFLNEAGFMVFNHKKKISDDEEDFITEDQDEVNYEGL